MRSGLTEGTGLHIGFDLLSRIAVQLDGGYGLKKTGDLPDGSGRQYATAEEGSPSEPGNDRMLERVNSRHNRHSRKLLRRAEHQTRIADALTRPANNGTIARQLVHHARAAHRQGQGAGPARRP